MTAAQIYRTLMLSLGGGKKISSGEYKVAAVASAINRSKDKFFDLVSSDVDRNELYERWLSPIVFYDQRLKLKKRGEEYDVYEKPKNVGKIESTWVMAERGECSKKIVAHPLPIKSIDPASVTDNWKASFDFEDSWRHVVSEGIRIFHHGDFKNKSAFASWVELIPDIHFPSVADGGSYVYTDGKKYEKDVDLELGQSAYDIIIEGAEILLRGNPTDLNLTLTKSINTRKLI